MNRRQRNDKLWSRASFTVEATFVVPILLGIVFTIMYLLFLFHDRIVLQENGYKVVCSMAEGTMSADTPTMKKEVEDALWIMKVKEAKVSKKNQKISGTVLAQAQWDIPVMNFFLNRVQEVNWSQEVSCVHPEEVKVWKK